MISYSFLIAPGLKQSGITIAKWSFILYEGTLSFYDKILDDHEFTQIKTQFTPNNLEKNGHFYLI